MTPTITPDGRLVLGDATLSTEEVDELLCDIALLRETMQPRVPATVPREPGVNLVTMSDPSFAISRHADGRITVSVRHAGFGWFVLALSDRAAATLRDALHKRLPGIPVDPVAEKVPDGHGPKH